MKPVKSILFLVAFASIFMGCRKEALEVYPDLEGEWNSELFTEQNGILIRVLQPGQDSYYTEIIDGDRTNEVGKAEIKNDILKIGKNKIKITSYPGYDNLGNYSFNTTDGKFIGAYAVVHPEAIAVGTTATFQWEIPRQGSKVDTKFIDYKISANEEWTTIDCSQHVGGYILSGLQPATSYEWRIKTKRGIHSSAYSAIQTFTTQ
jgi:hypothetical protein